MKLLKILYSWFGYTRSERAGSVILVVIVTFILVLRLVNPAGNFANELRSPGSDSMMVNNKHFPAPVLFEFDPNTVSRDSLLALGLNERQAATLINYRESGAIFKEAEDFRKVYGISGSMQDSLVPYILIRDPGKEQESVPGRKKSAAKEPVKDQVSQRDKAKAEAVAVVVDAFKPIEINSADSCLLMTIPGIGKVLGPRIVKYRNLLGGFRSVSQLEEVYGIDKALLDNISKYIRTDSMLIRTIDLNRAGYVELIRHPYISRKNTEDILSYRRLEGYIPSLGLLVRNNILSDSLLKELGPYLVVADSLIIAK